jgi:Cu-Zn family superoxide dismutase
MSKVSKSKPKSKITAAIAVFMQTPAISKHKISGIIHFLPQSHSRGLTLVRGEIRGLRPNHKHGFHIHEAGDLSMGCQTLCAHYNPRRMSHGGHQGKARHAGDLGNLRANRAGVAKIRILVRDITPAKIWGRSLVIHEDEDDLGRGEYEDSKMTGHSGARIACAIIGRKMIDTNKQK